jgi:hypothetical protein
MYPFGTFSVIIAFDAIVAELIIKKISMTTIVNCTLEVGPVQRSVYQALISAVA